MQIEFYLDQMIDEKNNPKGKSLHLELFRYKTDSLESIAIGDLHFSKYNWLSNIIFIDLKGC